MRSRFAVHLAITGLAAAGALSCSGTHDPAVDARPPITVEVATVAPEPIAGGFEAGGTVRALTVAPLSSRIVSPILQIHVEAGDRVKRGQRLVTLDTRQLDASAAAASANLASSRGGAAAIEAETRAAEAALALAKTTYDRIRSLHERRSATTGELDEATAALKAAEARLEGARARRTEVASAIDAASSGADVARVTASYGSITAPFDGVVTEVPAQAGTMAAPGQTLVVIEDTRRYRLEARVDATRASAVAAGGGVSVQIAGGETLPGTIAEIGESLDPSAHTFLVKIDLPATEGLRSGLFGRARFTTGEEAGIAVPEAAIVRRGQLTLVFVERDGIARMRAIHAGETVAGRVRVLAGVEAGDRLILAPPPGLLDGTPVIASARRQP